MRTALSQFANIPASAIRVSIQHKYKILTGSKYNFPIVQGSRAPYLQTSGDDTFRALKDLGMLYDVSLVATDAWTNPPIWPYTMDFGVQKVRRTSTWQQECCAFFKSTIEFFI